MEGEHTIADDESAVDKIGFVHDRLPCMVTRWSFLLRHKLYRGEVK
jgi:hypothetical protein